MLKRMRNMLPLEIRLSIYTSFITTHFNYCAETWHFCNKTSADKLEKVNERAIRFVFKDKSAPYEELLKKTRNYSFEASKSKTMIVCNVYQIIKYHQFST